MAFCLIMGTQDFHKQMDEYKGQTFQCRNCGNWRAYCQKSWRWFTICWIPVIPFSMGWDKDVFCPICRVTEDIKVRTDITSGQNQGQQLQQGMGSGQGGHNNGGGGYGGGPPPQQQYGGYK